MKGALEEEAARVALVDLERTARVTRRERVATEASVDEEAMEVEAAQAAQVELGETSARFSTRSVHSKQVQEEQEVEVDTVVPVRAEMEASALISRSPDSLPHL